MTQDNNTEIEKKLIYLYQQQTRDERDCQVTIEQNGVGFNAFDAGFCSSVAEWILSGKYPTPKQLSAVKTVLSKYEGQLSGGEWSWVELPEHLTQVKSAPKPTRNTLDIGENGGLVFTPVVYPSKQIRTLAPFFWKDKAWHQSKGSINQTLVKDIVAMFGEVEISEKVLKVLNPDPVVLPEQVADHEQLFPFQKETIQFALQAKHAMLCLAPGLGKTACAIFAAQAAGCKKILVISPLSLVRNWEHEIEKWVEETAEIAYKTQQPNGSRWTITNYDTIRIHPDNFMNVKWDCIIIDESILIKNRKALRTKQVKDLVKKTNPEYVWLLSGAPTSRLLDDMWSQLNLIDPNRFTSYWRFTERYCYVTQDQWGWHILGNREGSEQMLQQDLGDIYFARTQNQVLDLPEWIFQNIYVPMTPKQETLYNQMENEFVANLSEDNVLLAPNILSQMTRLVQLASNPLLVGGGDTSGKWKAVEETLEYVELPAIIWTSFIRTAEMLEEKLSEHYRVAILTGSTKQEERQDIVDKFQAGELDILIAHPGVGKFGFTLTAARTAIYLERNYNADDYYQSLHRVRRIGTKQSPLVIHLISERKNGGRTIDHVIDKILEGRKNTVIKLTTGELKTMFGEDK